MTNRHYQRIARHKVSQVFELRDEHVVHHKDGNHFNTRLDNFMVFASQGDHIKYHHQLRRGEVTVEPVWDSADYERERVSGLSAADRIRKKIKPIRSDEEILAESQAKLERIRRQAGNVPFSGGYSKERQLGKRKIKGG